MTGQEILAIEYKGQRVVTLKQIDEIHCRPSGTAKRQYSQNRDRFEKDRDFFTPPMDEIRTLGIGTPQGGGRGTMLFTARGYGKIIKGWNDDHSWKLHAGPAPPSSCSPENMIKHRDR